jgi:hypothetical protein
LKPPVWSAVRVRRHSASYVLVTDALFASLSTTCDAQVGSHCTVVVCPSALTVRIGNRPVLSHVVVVIAPSGSTFVVSLPYASWVHAVSTKPPVESSQSRRRVSKPAVGPRSHVAAPS